MLVCSTPGKESKLSTEGEGGSSLKLCLTLAESR